MDSKSPRSSAPEMTLVGIGSHFPPRNGVIAVVQDNEDTPLGHDDNPETPEKPFNGHISTTTDLQRPPYYPRQSICQLEALPSASAVPSLSRETESTVSSDLIPTPWQQRAQGVPFIPSAIQSLQSHMLLGRDGTMPSSDDQELSYDSDAGSEDRSSPNHSCFDEPRHHVDAGTPPSSASPGSSYGSSAGSPPLADLGSTSPSSWTTEDISHEVDQSLVVQMPGYQDDDYMDRSVQDGESDDETPARHHREGDDVDKPVNRTDSDITQRSSKRKRRPKSPESDTDDEEELDTRFIKHTRRSTVKIYFACPFLKMDPIKYRTCYHKHLSKVSYVKQHIRRQHAQPAYCPVCMSTFDDEETRDEHVRARTCQEAPKREFEGASTKQLAQLSKRSDPKKEEVEQWYDMYQILFPGTPRPASAYIDPEVSDDLVRFRTFAQGEGARFLADVVSREVAVQDKQVLEGLISDGLNRMVQDWLRERNSLRGSGREETAPAAQGKTEKAEVKDTDGKGRKTDSTREDDDQQERPDSSLNSPIEAKKDMQHEKDSRSGDAFWQAVGVEK